MALERPASVGEPVMSFIEALHLRLQHRQSESSARLDRSRSCIASSRELLNKPLPSAETGRFPHRPA
jgi:hypothetical protein